MNVVLVSTGVFQEYMLINIRQLLKLGHRSIYVITEWYFFDRFSEFDTDFIHLISVDSLIDVYEYANNCKMNKEFRDGFWVATSSRFFYIYALMARDNLNDVIHIENDVLLYYNCNILKSRLDKSKIYLPFDSYSRSIASIVYIPEHSILKSVLDQYNYVENDMCNFSNIRGVMPGLIDQFPIYRPLLSHTSEQNHVCTNFEKFNFIFDAAAIGQYLGGVDPRNLATPSDSRGFINETCVIKYDKCSFEWVNGNDGISRPMAVTESDMRVPIFNLHIHSKCLDQFC
jgi:hypothetical protein